MSQECSFCGATKPSTEFFLHSNGKPRKQCKQCRITKDRSWKQAHPEKVYKPVGEAYHKALAATRKWREQNKSYDAARAQLYRTRKLKQMPCWADKEAIFQFYKNCPAGFHVDHVVPLRGKLVSGFHVLDNLQYLPARDNMVKGNRYG